MKKTIALMFALIFFLNIISFTSALAITSVLTSPDEVAPGESSVIRITLKNNDDVDIENVAISLDFSNVPFAPYNSGSDYTINELLEGKTKEAQFNIMSLNNAKSGVYKIPLSITYNEADQAVGTPSKVKTSLISMTVNSKPILEVNAEDGLLLKGQNKKIILKVVNKGLADAKFLEIEVQGSTNANILSQNKIYIGDVDSNDFQTAEFEIFFNQNSLNLVNLPVNIVYKDITNKEYSEDYNIQLRVYSNEQAIQLGLIQKSNTGMVIGVVVILVIVFFIYRFIRNRRRNKEEY